MQNHFSEKTCQTVKLFKIFLPILEFHINLFWSLSKAYIHSFEWLNIGLRLSNTKFGRRIQNRYSEEVRQTLELFKSFLPTLQFPTDLFWSLSKASIESSVWSNIRLRVYNDKNCRRIQTHFSGKLRQISKLCKSFVLMLEFPINSLWSLSKA